MIMKNYMKSLAVFSAAMLIVSGQNVLLTAHGEHVRKIVVLGDSIATGAGLAENESSYVDLLEDYTNIQIQNFAQAHYTTGDMLTCLSDSQVQEALSQADVILINIGEHDIMDSFLEVSKGFMAKFGFEKFTDVFSAKLEDYGFKDENDLMPYANEMAAAIRENQDSAAENIQLINTELSKYPQAEIIWQTDYNLLDTLDFYDTLSTRRQTAYGAIMNPAKTTLNKALNTYIAQFAEADNCIVADISAEFAGKAYEYTNLYQLDLNPTAAGHARIAEMIIQQSGLSRMGDVTDDKVIDASDAAQILLHAANAGSGKEEILNADQITGGDVDEDGMLDSADAAQILVYAAYEGTGQSYQFKKKQSVELAGPDPTQPTDTELADPDPTQPTDAELADPDPTQPVFEK